MFDANLTHGLLHLLPTEKHEKDSIMKKDIDVLSIFRKCKPSDKEWKAMTYKSWKDGIDIDCPSPTLESFAKKITEQTEEALKFALDACELHILIRNGKGESKESEEVRDRMDLSWRKMTIKQEQLGRKILEKLYEIQGDPIKRVEGCRSCNYVGIDGAPGSIYICEHPNAEDNGYIIDKQGSLLPESYYPKKCPIKEIIEKNNG